MPGAPKGQKSVRSPGTGITVLGWHVGAGNRTHVLEEQPVLLIAELPLQSTFLFI